MSNPTWAGGASQRRRDAFAILIGGFLLFLSLRGVSPSLFKPQLMVDYSRIYSGEMLLHRITRHAGADGLPLMSVLAAVLFNHSPAGWAQIWRAASGTAAIALRPLYIAGFLGICAAFAGSLGLAFILVENIAGMLSPAGRPSLRRSYGWTGFNFCPWERSASI